MPLCIGQKRKGGTGRSSPQGKKKDTEVTKKNHKTAIPTIAEKNRIIANVIEAILQGDDFLLIGHQHPDEDCVASMVAFGLLLSKLEKRSYITACAEINENFQYLLNICKYNSISVIEDCEEVPDEITAMIILDTPKPTMLMHSPATAKLYADPQILHIELDHHLEADSSFCGDPGYRLVDEASSTCELIGFLAFKLRNREELFPAYRGVKIFTRNFVLAVLTGIIGDSKMGKYLKSNRERWFYNLFSSMFNEILRSETFSTSANLSDMTEVYDEIFRLSDEEENCYRYFMERKNCVPKVCYIVMEKKDSEQINSAFQHETVVNISRTVADKLAEESGYLSLVGFYDDPEHSNFIQFRMRRSEHYRGIDLRTIIAAFSIENGGGHKGAIGFRIDRENLPDLKSFIDELLTGTQQLIEIAEAN